jgi:hypothetical protein
MKIIAVLAVATRIRTSSLVALVALVALMAACAPPGPEARGIPLRDCEPGVECNVYDSDIHKVYNQDKAMLMFERMVEDTFGRSFDNVWQSTEVWWTTAQCPYSDEPAVVQDNVCYHGKMYSCQEMYVALPKTGKTCGSALLHEFGHCLSMHLAGSGFADGGNSW